MAIPSADIIVVAPDRGRSECSHSVTNTRPLNIRQITPHWYSVDGTPVDCVRAALASITQPDLVFSGINAGANLGTNLMISGTFAAAREAALQGYHAMAISHYRRPDVPKDWQHCPRWLKRPVTDFVAATKASQTALLWNANLPAIDSKTEMPPIKECCVDQCPIPRQAVRDGDELKFTLDFHGRPRGAGTDVDLCFAGNLTISKLTPFV